jgi:hypothetical protein
VSFVEPPRMYGVKEIQSSLSMSPTVLPPWALVLLGVVTPEELSKCSACRWRGWSFAWSRPVSAAWPPPPPSV